MEMVFYHLTHSFISYLMGFIYIGYWSSGTRLSDSARITGDGIQEGDLPEYMVLSILCACPGTLLTESIVWWSAVAYSSNSHSSPT